MSVENIITSIDIGSSKIRTFIGHIDNELNNIQPQVLGVGISDSNAIRKGNIFDMEEFRSNLDKSLEEAENISGEQVNGAFISFNSSNIEVISSRGIIAISGDEITNEDIDRVLEIAKNGVHIINKKILKIIPDTFIVDFEEGVKNPVGMAAKKLEVKANIFCINNNIINNITKAIEDVGIEIYDIYPNLISSPEGILSKRQKELGVVCVDIGDSTTGVTVYEEGSLKFASIIPVGSGNVTNDITLLLRINIEIAEKLKIEYGELNISKIENFEDFNINLNEISSGEEEIISKSYLSKIIEARYQELLYLIKYELKKIGKDGMLPEGVVFVGGGSKMKGLLELSKSILKLPATIGYPFENETGLDKSMNDPSFSALLGNIIVTNKYRNKRTKIVFNFKSIFTSIIKVLKKLLP